MRFLTKKLPVIVIFLVMNISVLSAVSMVVVSALAEGGGSSTLELGTIDFYLRGNYRLSPAPPDPDQSPKTINCPAKMDPMYPQAPGKFVQMYEWASLTQDFETEQVSRPVHLGNRVSFTLWFGASEEDLGEIKFKLTLLHNDEPVAQTEALTYSNLVKNEDGCIQGSAGLNTTGYMLQPGDGLSMHIDYYVIGDGLVIKFDSILYDSGFDLEADPLSIDYITNTERNIIVYYSEAFGVDGHALFFRLKVDGKIIESEPQLGTSPDGNYVNWDVDLLPGTREIVIYVSYRDYGDGSMVKMEKNIQAGTIIDDPVNPGNNVHDDNNQDNGLSGDGSDNQIESGSEVEEPSYVLYIIVIGIIIFIVIAIAMLSGKEK